LNTRNSLSPLLFFRKKQTLKTVQLKSLVSFISLALILFVVSNTDALANEQNNTLPQVAIIIDDMGYRATDKRAFELPEHVTFAILPHTSQSSEFAYAAHQQGRTVMLHLPMETLQPRNLGPGALLDTMDTRFLTETFEQALASVPHASGVNNHMGSKLTQLTLPMTTLMQSLMEHELFFVDSRTTRYSKALKIAKRQGVPSTRRHVFLDHELTHDFIDQQFALLVRLAKKKGQAVGIGHPHPLTIERLQQHLSRTEDIEFVSVSALLDEPMITATPKIAEAGERLRERVVEAVD
jgi:polysaccharide deacetylase 2 family uncharacterized protein YibQ